MFTVIIVLVIAVAAFVSGMLIYKNNKKKIDAAKAKAEEVIDVIKK